MPEAEQNPSERLTRETTIGLTKQSVAEAHEQNPNALGVVIHGSRANEAIEMTRLPKNWGIYSGATSD